MRVGQGHYLAQEGSLGFVLFNAGLVNLKNETILFLEIIAHPMSLQQAGHPCQNQPDQHN